MNEFIKEKLITKCVLEIEGLECDKSYYKEIGEDDAADSVQKIIDAYMETLKKARGEW